MDFAEYLRKPDVSENDYYGRYLPNGLHRLYISKSGKDLQRWNVQYLEVS